jgi:hypothetical protein
MQAWQNDESARTPSLWTDGRVVYSYDMPIACTDKDGEILVIARGYKAPSNTTAQHIGGVRTWIAINCGNGVQETMPDVIKNCAKNTELTFHEAWIMMDEPIKHGL